MWVAIALVALAAALVLGIAYWAVVRGHLGAKTIRTRLLLGFVLMAAVPALAISSGTVAVGYANGRRQALDRLQSVAARKQSEILAWTRSVQGDLAAVVSVEYGLQEIGVALDLARDHKYYDFFAKAVRDRLGQYASQSARFQELSLVDLNGQVILSSDATPEGRSWGSEPCTAQPPALACVQLTTNADSPGSFWLRAAAPVADLNGHIAGALGGTTGVQALADILREATGLDQSGRSYLVGLQGALLFDAATLAGVQGGSPPRSVHSDGIDATLKSQGTSHGTYVDYRGTPVVGVYRWLADLQVALVVEQAQSEAFQAIPATLAINMAIAMACLVLAVGASLGITRSIASPLVRLAGTAGRIAGGDLQQTTLVTGEDEVGALARAFNSMTMQLRGLIGRLEERVAERIQALERRALQLETSARVSREITSILGIDDLLARVAELIRVTFRYYHVNVFLVNPDSDQLQLRATSGTTRPESERLTVADNSLNGHAVQSNRTLLANDVGQEPRFRPDPSLPETRAELVIPLRVADRVVGTLDVHSSVVNVFSSEDVLVLESLADQIAIAIENARLYVRSRELATLEERNRLARELHDVVTQSLYSITLMAETWRRLAGEAGRAEEESHLRTLGEAVGQTLREARLLVHELRPSALQSEGLLGALHQRLDTVERRSGVEARLVADELLDLPCPVEEELFGIAVEALNNAIKHSGATSLTIRIRATGEQVVLEVQDNGRGFDPVTASDRGGLGLVTMRERAARLGGRLSVESAPAKGTTVRAEVPSPCPFAPFRASSLMSAGEGTRRVRSLGTSPTGRERGWAEEGATQGGLCHDTDDPHPHCG